MTQFVEEYGATYDGNTLSITNENNSIQLQYPSNIPDGDIHDMFRSFVKIKPKDCEKLRIIKQKCIDAGLEYDYKEDYSSGPGCRNPDIYIDKYVTIGSECIRFSDNGYHNNLDDMDMAEINQYFDTVINIIQCKDEYVESLKVFGGSRINFNEFNPIVEIEINECRKLRIDIDVMQKKFVGRWPMHNNKLIYDEELQTEATVENIKKIIEMEKSITGLYKLLHKHPYCRICICENNRTKLVTAYNEYLYLESKFEMNVILQKYFIYTQNDLYYVTLKKYLSINQTTTYNTFTELCEYLATIEI